MSFELKGILNEPALLQDRDHSIPEIQIISGD